ncbi:MAG: hypothetical protein V2I43_17205 [Parvularcula sp.]|jgi:poly(3-hydroxybutyrate) depolymerase|nr:hypothetical protein [Parvularcula sp.]
MRRFLSILLLLPVLLIQHAWAGDARTGTFLFSDWDGPPLTVHFVEPDGTADRDAPVVIVLHGVGRNADDYAANWQDIVEQYGFRVYAPEFTRDDFPGADYYNLGGIGTDGPYAFTALEPLFAAVRGRGGEATGYYLFGHSAGAQVVHRALLFEDLDHLELAIAANAGWYTMPDTEAAWPYGLARTEADETDLQAWFGKPLMILLGGSDTDPRDRNLRRSKEALEQGPHRFARGEAFIRAAQAKAAELGVPFIWRGSSVPGVAHDNAGMAKGAAPIIAAHARLREGDGE